MNPDWFLFLLQQVIETSHPGQFKLWALIGNHLDVSSPERLKEGLF